MRGRPSQVLFALAGLMLTPLAARADGPTYSCKDWSQLDQNGEPVIVFTNVPTDPRCRPLRRTASAAGVYRDPPQARARPPGGPDAAAPGPAHARFVSHIRAAADKYKLPEALLVAVMAVESNFDPQAVSEKGAMGLMQLMPATAREMFVSDPFDPAQNIEGGARYLRILANQYSGDPMKTLAAYNAGPDAVRRSGEDVPNIPETRAYVRRVLDLYRSYRADR
ncbi:MAG TPA: lytic transglycosylase domain-containing protein [Anaeromyxobacteraceae bacterium]|nr:lytic transglycosylase domain-containing protein [Anaeromyxobacteraceae bacterium]